MEEDQSHIKQCASVLRQCSRCKVYVERRHYDSHNRLCSKSLNYLDKESRNPSDAGTIHLRQNLHSTQNGSDAFLINSQPYIYKTDNVQANGSLTEKNIYGIPSRPREEVISSEQKYYQQPQYASLERNEHSAHIRDKQAYTTRPMSVISSDSDHMHFIRNELSLLKTHLAEEQNQREKLQNEVTKMRKQYLLSEERNQILLATITTLRNNIEDESEKYQATYSLLRREVDSLRHKTDELIQAISQVEIITSNLQKDIEREQIDRSHLDLIVNAQDNKLRTLSKIENNLEMLKNNVNQQQQTQKDISSHINKEISQLKELYATEISKHNKQLSTLEEELAGVAQQLKSNADNVMKYDILNKESKALMGIVEDDSKKVQKIEQDIKSLSDNVAVLQKQRYTSLLEPNTLQDMTDTTGHFMWKICEFEKKLKDSMDNGTVLLSPIFYSSKYGYALQGELHLNGLGKWKGRHITACVFIVPGIWDPILVWPAKLTAKIILRDQMTKAGQAVHIIKALQVRKRDHKEDIKILQRNSLQRSEDRRRSTENLSTIEKEARAIEANIKRQYVFIAHSSLDKFDYIKNDVMFVEIIVQDN